MFDKLNIGKLFVDRLGDMFGNMIGRMFGGVPTGEGSEEQADYIHDNVMFEQQSKVGRAKGEMASPEPMRKQIKNFYKAKSDGLIKKGVVVLEASPDEENTLG